jgi:hypothetical protein
MTAEEQLELLRSTPLTRVLMSIPSDRIWFSDEDDNSILNKFKILVEEFTEEDWDWWPLRMLQKDQTRVHWLCVSNSNLGNVRRKLIYQSIVAHTYGLNYQKHMLIYVNHCYHFNHTPYFRIAAHHFTTASQSEDVHSNSN